MMPITARWFTGFIIAITQVIENFSQECTVYTTPIVYWDCSNVLLESLSHINDTASIEVLNISYIEGLETFSENYFENFTKLKILDMKGLKLTGSNPLPGELFLKLTQLERLDITGTSGTYTMPTKLPVSVKYLLVNEIEKSEQFDFSVLDNLVELHMAQSICKDFPKLSKIAPLIEMNFLLSTGMDNFHYENVSYYCLLKTLVFDQHSRLTQPEHQEQCCGLLEWTRVNEITGINTNIFHCYENCGRMNIKISSFANNERDECFVRLGLRTRNTRNQWSYLIIAVIAFLVLATVAFVVCGLWWYFYLKRSSRGEVIAENLQMEEAEEMRSLASVEEDTAN